MKNPILQTVSTSKNHRFSVPSISTDVTKGINAYFDLKSRIKLIFR